MSRHLLLVVVAVLTATAYAQIQPCPFDCMTCDGNTQTCLTCADGFRLDNGRCHLEQCDTAMAHKPRFSDSGVRDDSMATWDISSVDGTTHTVTIDVTVPPRFHCELTGHALSDALNWEEWLTNATNSPCPAYVPIGGPTGYCGPSNKRWTPVLMLGREADTAEGFIKLPIGVANSQQSCTSAYRNNNDKTIVDMKSDGVNFVTSYDAVTGDASFTIPLMEISDPTDPLWCPELRTQDLISGVDQAGQDGARFKYWKKELANNGDTTNWRFDATLCYVDETGEQSVCPFSSPVWEMSVNGITDGVSVTPAGTAELIYVPKCQLYIRSAQIRYDGEIENRNATGEFEIAVTCEGLDYSPDITKISHCQCEKDAAGNCIIYEEELACTSEECTVTALFKSTEFNASLSDFLQLECASDAGLEDGRFVVGIKHDFNDCATDDSCVEISDTKLFGAAPLQATDDLSDDLGDYNDTNSHSIFAGLMKENDLRVPTGQEEYFHQFNRTYLNFTTIRRVVGPDQKNSFVMCAMMQPDSAPRSDSIDPADISYKFKVSIQEVTFEITWADGRENTFETLADLLTGNERWPSQWVWEHQEELALRRQVLGRRTDRVNAPCGSGICQVSPLQDHVYTHTSEWDHIEENVDCVGISPFYLYSLLTLNEPEAIVSSAAVTLKVKHEYLGRYIASGNGARRLLQAGADGGPLSQATTQQYGGAFAWVSKSEAEAQQNNIVTKEQAATPESSSMPVMPIVIGTVAASMTCMFFAAFAFWRRRKQSQDKLGPQANFSQQQPHTQAQSQVVVQLDDIQLRQAGQV